MADLETKCATSGTILESVQQPKQFTAAAVLLFARDGKLSLDDPVRRSTFPVARLWRAADDPPCLANTAGLRDWGAISRAIEGWPRW